MEAKDNPKIVMVLDNLRSIHNVGAILRTANGFGVHEFIFIGTTPYPEIKEDPRPKFMAVKQTSQLHKTALGAEEHVAGKYFDSVNTYLSYINSSGVVLISIEQASSSITLQEYSIDSKAHQTHIVLGNEVNGVSPELLAAATVVLEIPMASTKESFNVEATAAMVLYHLLSS